MLLLSGTYIRMGLSLMADVPALFWSLLGVLLLTKDERRKTKDGSGPGTVGSERQLRVEETEYAVRNTQYAIRSFVLAFASGLALGLAILTRYGAAFLLGPLALYLYLRWRRERPQGIGTRHPSPDTQHPTPSIRHFLLLVLGIAAGLLPQAVYLLTHQAGAGYSAFLADWNPANAFATTVTGVDGSATYDYPMIVFYVVMPLLSAQAGFLSYLMLPCFVWGIASLWRRREWASLVLLLGWWLIPALIYSGTPYQAHRFVIQYMPALAILIGVGAAEAAEAVWRVTGTLGFSLKSLSRAAGGGVVWVLLALGAIMGWRGVRDWMGAHAAFKAEERAVLALVREAASGANAEPRIVSFGITAAIHHYTGWPTIDLYNHDPASIERFWGAPGPRILVAPEEQLSTQWKGTPLEARWIWLQAGYVLQAQGKAGQYSIYRIDSGSTSR
jgi:4-amino-4-deoxy-L-arabinose transferase-like glycosyltransferase